MDRLIAVAFTLALASSAQAMPVSPIQQPDEMVTRVQACGPGMHRVNGVCRRNNTVRACPGGQHLVNGRCVRPTRID
jgi:hypothetical protein